MTKRQNTDMGFPAALPMAYVLKSVSLGDFLELHGHTLDDWDKFNRNPAFKAAVSEAEKLVSEEGGAFKMKARAMAEQFLPEAEAIVKDENAPPAVRADLIKAMIKVAGLDGSVDQRSNKTSGNNVQIQIDLT